MTRKAWSIAAIVLVFGTLATWELSRHVSAAEPPACLTPEEFVEALPEGSKLAGAAYYAGSVTDELLVIESKETISFFGFKDGCLEVYQALEAVKSKGTPA